MKLSDDFIKGFVLCFLLMAFIGCVVGNAVAFSREHYVPQTEETKGREAVFVPLVLSLVGSSVGLVCFAIKAHGDSKFR